ncbi:MAG: serine/threonine protein kinase, partial [Deltaproteobacteria bacterium]|nr:serine/threonine protein kinase [Deltaproteobacteria bacterium]
MRTLTFNRIVGSGAMGTVYHAELRVPRGFSRTCAVKVMKTSGPDHEHFRGRMRDEARLLGMLQDEQVLGVSEMVQIEGRDAVIMEFVEGVDFSEVIQTNPVPPRALAELGAEVAGTLYRAHSARHPQTGELLHVIHRDIKPANIMVTSRGGVRILDFGVARAAFASRESHTQGLVLGTLNYFPPEILVGNDPTPAVDIYGLGLTVWECATGRDWGAPRVQRVQFERRVDRRIEELGKDYTPLVAVLRQVLQWDPELRPDGGGLERMLLAASEECSGQGLRTWSRDVVPQLLSGRTMKVVSDPLLGRTIKIENPGTPAPA